MFALKLANLTKIILKTFCSVGLLPVNENLVYFRLIMYPNREVKDIPKGAFLSDGRTMSTPPHQDSGFLTLLQTFGFPGLELELDGVWYSVPCPKGMLVVNVGEQLSAMSNNRFKATIHRVLDIGQDRYVLITNEYMTYNDPFLSIDFPIHSFMNHVWMPTSM